MVRALIYCILLNNYRAKRKYARNICSSSQFTIKIKLKIFLIFILEISRWGQIQLWCISILDYLDNLVKIQQLNCKWNKGNSEMEPQCLLFEVSCISNVVLQLTWLAMWLIVTKKIPIKFQDECAWGLQHWKFTFLMGYTIKMNSLMEFFLLSNHWWKLNVPKEMAYWMINRNNIQGVSWIILT